MYYQPDGTVPIPISPLHWEGNRPYLHEKGGMQHIHPSTDSHSFLSEHCPRAAEASFNLGVVGHGGGFSIEDGSVPDRDMHIGYYQDDRLHEFPYCHLATEAFKSGMADFIPVGHPEGNKYQKKIPIRFFREEEIEREYRLATDTFRAPGISLTLTSAATGIPDPATVPYDAMKDALAPAIIARITFDNRDGQSLMTGVWAVEMPYFQFLEDITGGQFTGVAATLDGYGFGVRSAAHVRTFSDFDINHAFRRPKPLRTRAEGLVGLLVDVPAGECVTLDIALGWYRPGIITMGKECAYAYTRYFTGLQEVISYALDHAEGWLADAKAQDEMLLNSSLNAHQQFLYAKSVHSYWGSTQLFLDGSRYRWVVNEGSCNMINTLDLTIDMAFFELRHHPWLLRNVLDSFADEYYYYDTVHFPNDPTAYPGGISFTHDQGLRNSFYRNHYSFYELEDHPGCFSYMTHEELLNWVLCAAMYVQRTGDRDWLHQRAGILADCLLSMQHRDHPDPAQRDGVMDLDSDRCGRESEITTYDSLDPSLGQSRRNTYLAVKCWAAYLALVQLLSLENAERYAPEIAGAGHSARLCADTVTRAFDEKLGYIPAILEDGDTSAIIPIIEGLVYPTQLGLADALAADGPYAELLAALKRHLHNVLIEGRCLFPDGGWKLSGNNDNSWMSKIFICQYVARQVLGCEFGEAGLAADRAHDHWWRVGCKTHSVVDQVIAGACGAFGSIYPRCVSAILWLEE